MFIVLISSAVSLAIGVLLVWLSRHHVRALLDHDTSGPQKLHAAIVPRVGGIGIAAGLLAVLAVWPGSPGGLVAVGWLLMFAVPVFAAGLAEDLTKRVSPRMRLVASMVSAALAAGPLGTHLATPGVPGLEWLAAAPVLAMVVTLLCVGGLTHAINLIDGLNGLASMVMIIAMVAIHIVAGQVGDTVVAELSLLGIGALLGFFALNFPYGRIFLGDGGAYLMGFWLAQLCLMLVLRNPGEVSFVFPLLLCIYPVFETAFTIYRRKMLRGHGVGYPDGIHLHQLVYRRYMRRVFGTRSHRASAVGNSMSAPFLWALSSLAAVPAVLLHDSTPWLLACMAGFALLYLWLYRRIVRFCLPRWAVPKVRPAAVPSDDFAHSRAEG